MPVVVRKRSGARPWKIVEKASGKVVGSSTSRAQAQRSANARNAAHYTGWKPTGKPARKPARKKTTKRLRTARKRTASKSRKS